MTSGPGRELAPTRTPPPEVGVPRPTGRGLALLVTAVAGAAGAWGLGWTALWLPAATCAALLLLGLVLVGVPSSVRLDRALVQDRVPEQVPALVRVRAENVGRWRSVPLTAAEQLAGAARRIRVRVPSLAPGAERTVHAPVPAARRGRYVLAGLRGERTDPFGTWVVRGRLSEPTVLWVQPAVVALPALLTSRVPELLSEGSQGTAGGDEDVLAVRDYAVGDDPRRVHWRATAHRGRLMVVDRATGRRTQVRVVCDPRRPEGVAEDEALATVEHVVRLTASTLALARSSWAREAALDVPGLDVAACRRLGARDDADLLTLVPAAAPPSSARSVASAELFRADASQALVVVSGSGDPDLVRLAARRGTGTVLVLCTPDGATGVRAAGGAVVLTVGRP
ncbi:hypothetical protein GCM10028777_22730 [Angustibacter speluncae]